VYVIPVLMRHLDTAFSYDFENDGSVILVGVGIGITCVFKLNDVARADALCLPMNTPPPYVSSSMFNAGREIGQVGQTPALTVTDLLADMFFGKGDNLFGCGAWLAYLSDYRPAFIF
jgi:hypothetical protein